MKPFLLPRHIRFLYKTLLSRIHLNHLPTTGSLSTRPVNKELNNRRDIFIQDNSRPFSCGVAVLQKITATNTARTMTKPGGSPLLDASVTEGSQSAVLRYTLGEERFQLKLVYNNKVFNFNRSVSDSLESIFSRIVTNISKKVKTWDESVSFFTLEGNGSLVRVELTDKSILVSSILEQVLRGECKLNIKISDQVYDVVVNPPSVLSIKFLKQAAVGFPIIPYKIETSSNFDRDASKYRWEFTREAKVELNVVGKKKNQNPKKVTSENDCNWIDTGCSGYIFTPGEELIGARLRLTFFPSDGACFGLPFSEELPVAVTKAVDKPLYEERLGRILKNGPAKEKTMDPNSLRFVTYNCLAECYATEEWFIASPKNALPADFRLPFLCKEFSEYCGDVYCLQEIDDKYFERIFTPFFECVLGYKGFFSPKTGSVKEGVAMFSNPKKLTCIKNETVVITEHLKTMSIWEKIPSPIKERLDERNSVLQVSIFRAIAKEKTIVIIANTHLYFYPDADHIRLLQTMSCVNYIETVSSEIEKNFEGFRVTVMFCGDFNCTPPFSSFRYLTTGKIEVDDFDWTSHSTEKLVPGLSLQHALKLTNSNPEHELTNITSCFEGCIDYILYQAQHFDLVCTYPPPHKATIAEILNVSETRLVSLPNLYTPSDHLPLIADFQLK